MGETAQTYKDRMWRRPIRPLCPSAQSDPDPCDCGHVGAWMWRLVREQRRCRKPDCFGCRYGPVEGHPRIVGREEMCPRCGDVELFTLDGELVEQRRNQKFTGARNEALDDDLWAQLGMDE